MGYAELADDVWVSPFPRGELTSVLEHARASARTAHADRFDPAPTAAWDLAALRAAYDAWPAAAEALIERHERVHADPDKAAFAARFHLVHEWRKFLFADPGLPDELLPGDWPGRDGGRRVRRARRRGSSRAPTGSWRAAWTSIGQNPPHDCHRHPVLLDLADGVATITLNRPDAMNSLDVATKEALLETVRPVAEDPAVRCVVLTGTGRAFCVGQDLKEHIEILHSESSEALFRTVDEHYNPIVTALATMPKPVVAAVNGVAAGAGASLAFACDLRILADSAGFNLAFANVALSCDTGASYHLQRLVGRAKAIELLYFPTHDLGRGLARRSAWPPGWSRRRARGHRPRDRRAPRRRADRGAGRDAPVGGLRLRALLRGGAGVREPDDAGDRRHPDHQAAVAAFVAKEKPVFEGR